MKTKTKNILFITIILITTFTAYYPCLNNTFTNLDDDKLVTANPLIKEFSIKNIAKIFTTFCNYEYRPLLYLSYTVEHSFYKLAPFGYHLVSLVLRL